MAEITKLIIPIISKTSDLFQHFNASTIVSKMDLLQLNERDKLQFFFDGKLPVIGRQIL